MLWIWRMAEVKMVTFAALKGISLVLLVHSYYQNQTDLLFDNNIDKNPFANLEINESDIEEANASFNLLDEDEEEDAYVCVNKFDQNSGYFFLN